MIITKIYLYDSMQEENFYRGTDYSAHLLQGVSTDEKLDETLDMAEVTLAGLNFSKEFAPKTKFILEFWEKRKGSAEAQLWESFHLCVAQDIVTQPIIATQTISTTTSILTRLPSMRRGGLWITSPSRIG